jgi:hypothetical protein
LSRAALKIFIEIASIWIVKKKAVPAGLKTTGKKGSLNIKNNDF